MIEINNAFIVVIVDSYWGNINCAILGVTTLPIATSINIISYTWRYNKPRDYTQYNYTQ